MKRTDMTDHSSLLYFLLGIVPTPALTSALSLFLSLPSSFPFIPILKNHKHYVVPSAHESLSRMLHYLRLTADREPLCILDYTAEAKKRKQPLALELKNDFTHSISLASIMTVCQHGEPAASKSDAKDRDAPSENST